MSVLTPGAKAPAKKSSKQSAHDLSFTDYIRVRGSRRHPLTEQSLYNPTGMCFNCLDVEFESMLICTECKSLALCRNCIVVDKREDTTVFTCFACATKKGETLPFDLKPAGLRHAPCTFVMQPTAVICLFLNNGRSDDASPSILVEESLASLYCVGNSQIGPICSFIHGISYDLDQAGNVMPQEELSYKLERFVEDEMEPLNVSKIIVFLHTHSDISTGGLFCRDDSQLTIDDLMKSLLPQTLRYALQNAEDTLLILSTCGYLFTQGISDVATLLERGLFYDVVGFGELIIHPILLAPWLIKFLQTYTIGAVRNNVAKSIESTISGADDLGGHTSLIHISNGGRNMTPTWMKYCWAPRTRPWGSRLEACLDCKANKWWFKKEGKEEGKTVRVYRCATQRCRGLSKAVQPMGVEDVHHAVAAPWVKVVITPSNEEMPDSESPMDIAS